MPKYFKETVSEEYDILWIDPWHHQLMIVEDVGDYFTLLCVRSIEEAVEALKVHKFKVIITELVMLNERYKGKPEHDLFAGLYFIEEIREGAIEILGECDIVVLTSNMRDDGRQKIYKYLGRENYFLKFAITEVLINRLNRIMNPRQNEALLS